jgi:hypothetical protein
MAPVGHILIQSFLQFLHAVGFFVILIDSPSTSKRLFGQEVRHDMQSIHFSFIIPTKSSLSYNLNNLYKLVLLRSIWWFYQHSHKKLQ